MRGTKYLCKGERRMLFNSYVFILAFLPITLIGYFLLGKILMGDKSDNIKQVFSKCGPKTALKLTKDKETLKKMLKENASAAQRFALNKKIISFNETPTELVSAIEKSLNEALYSEDVLNKATDLKSFMEW